MFNPIFHLLFQKTRQLNKELNVALKEHQLFSAQWSIIYCVKTHGEMTLTEIWKYLHVEPPTITRSVHRLCDLGWLVILPSADKREKVVKLSDFGMEKFPEIEKAVLQFEEQYLDVFSPEEHKQIMRLLHKF